jgi:murein L,D-transpeptidase YafK
MVKLFSNISFKAILVIIVLPLFWVSCNSQTAEQIVKSKSYLEALPKDKIADTNKAKPGDHIFLRIIKDENLLEIWVKQDGKHKLAESFPICYYSGGLGPKYKEGDGKSPEGFYFINKSRLNPHSSYHLAMNTGYPNSFDKANKYTGSYLMIHGNCVSIGCYAMTDKGIEKIYNWVEKALNNGQSIVRVHIFPFRMTQANLDKYKASKYYPFWKNIKTGYDFFEKNNRPPNVEVANKKYVFN